MNQHSDILICGAGPAGATTSLFLSKAGIAHTLIDKALFPRDKICGDALSGKTVDVLKHLDESWLDEMEANTGGYLHSSGVIFVSPQLKALEIPFKSHKSLKKGPVGFISRRVDFDHFLVNKLDKKSCNFLQGTALTSASRENGIWNIQLTSANGNTSMSPKLVIAADGDRSIIAKKFGAKMVEPKHYCAGIRQYYEGVDNLHPQGYIELIFLKEFLPGYLWIFPMADGRANVGAGMLSSEASAQKVNLKTKLNELVHTHDLLKDRFKNAKALEDPKGWGLPLGSKKRKISGDGFLLTGDAASLIDPFTGEGIGNAMLSGMIAADTIKEALYASRFDAQFLASYDKTIYHKTWMELQLSHRLQKLSKYPWLFNFVVNKAIKNTELRDTISCMFDDIDLRKKFSNPGFYFKILFG